MANKVHNNRPESPTWHASKYKVHKLHQKVHRQKSERFSLAAYTFIYLPSEWQLIFFFLGRDGGVGCGSGSYICVYTYLCSVAVGPWTSLRCTMSFAHNASVFHRIQKTDALPINLRQSKEGGEPGFEPLGLDPVPRAFG